MQTHITHARARTVKTSTVDATIERGRNKTHADPREGKITATGEELRFPRAFTNQTSKQTSRFRARAAHKPCRAAASSQRRSPSRSPPRAMCNTAAKEVKKNGGGDTRARIKPAQLAGTQRGRIQEPVRTNPGKRWHAPTHARGR